MIKVPTTELRKNFARYEAIALKEPVMVTQNGRDHAVMISAEEYRRLKRRDRQVLGLDDFTEDDIAAIRRQHPPIGAAPGADEEKSKKNSW